MLLTEVLATVAALPTDPDGCIRWPHAITHGYAVARVRTGPTPQDVKVRRLTGVVWVAAGNAPLLRGQVLDHLCHDPRRCPGGPACPHRACLNLSHLLLSTIGPNVRRGSKITAQLDRTHCPRNHPYDAENTYRWGGHRYCRECSRQRKRGEPLHA